MNVWILAFSNVNTERVFGPFSAVAVQSDTLTDPLTGRQLAHRLDVYPSSWLFALHNGASIAVDRFVIQQGGFESPWGERGIR